MIWSYLGAALILLVIGRISLGLMLRLLQARADGERHGQEMARFAEELALLREQRRKLTATPLPWSGFRKFVVHRTESESGDVRSFLLTPHDSQPLPGFKPGQYLTFRVPHGDGQLIRCYSLSDRPHSGHYRVTIKKLRGGATENVPAGASSSYFHDRVQEGDIVDVRAPAGTFTLDPAESHPVVLVGSGIGVTPIFSMLSALVHQRSRRPIWFFYGVRSGQDHIFKEELAIIARDNPHINLRVCYSRPGPDDVHNEDFHVHGRVTVELLRRTLPSNNYHFYYCGPGLMMEAMTVGLKQWGVPETHLHFETFTAMSVKRVSHATVATTGVAPVTNQVTFRKSNVTRPWQDQHGSLLDLAESAGIAIPSGCRAGSCGTCVVALLSGNVNYVHAPGIPLEARTCLTCLAQPKGDVALDA